MERRAAKTPSRRENWKALCSSAPWLFRDKICCGRGVRQVRQACLPNETNYPYAMNARTKTLFHFTRTLDNLMSILKEGFWPQYSLEDISWIEGGVPRLAWPMVSFCDMPISRLREHTAFYGNFGIGLCREQWRDTGLNRFCMFHPTQSSKTP